MKVFKLAKAITSACDGNPKIFKKINKAASDAIATTGNSATKSVVNPAYYQAINGIKVPKVAKEVIEQSRLYRQQNFIPSSQRILDGFKDGGSNARYLDDGSVVDSAREVIVVDRTKDSQLCSIISDFKTKIKDIDTDEELPSEFTQNYIFNRFAKKSLSASEIIEYPDGMEKYLGEILENGTPTCRHLALLYKILGDDIGLETDLVRGMATIGRKTERHAWVKIAEDGCTALSDPTNNIMTGYLEDVADSAFGEVYCRYVMTDGLPFD